MAKKEEKISVQGLQFNKVTEEEALKYRKQQLKDIEKKVAEAKEHYGENSILFDLKKEIYEIEYLSIANDRPEMLDDYHSEYVGDDTVKTMFIDRPTKYKRLRDNFKKVASNDLAVEKDLATDTAFLDKYRFDNFRTEKSHHKTMKQVAERFLKTNGKALLISGQVGCGKTHIGVATATQLLLDGKDVRYVKWKKEINNLRDFEKGGALIEELSNVEVLYIDDLFKQAIEIEGNTLHKHIDKYEAGVAFKILDERYTSGKQTIITTQYSLDQLLKIDEATISRLVEMTDGNYIQIAKKAGRNERLNKIIDC